MENEAKRDFVLLSIEDSETGNEKLFYIFPTTVWDEYAAPALDRLRSETRDLGICDGCEDVNSYEQMINLKRITPQEKELVERLMGFEKDIFCELKLPLNVYPDGRTIGFKYSKGIFGEAEEPHLPIALDFIELNTDELD